MNKRKVKKNLIKAKSIIINNREKISRMIISDHFLELMTTFPEIFEVNIIEDEEGTETFFVFGIPIMGSRFIHKNLVLEMVDGEHIIIKL